MTSAADQVDVTEIKKTFAALTLEKAIPALIVLAVGIVAVYLLTVAGIFVTVAIRLSPSFFCESVSAGCTGSALCCHP